MRFVEVEERLQGSELCAFDVDFEDIDEVVTVLFHESAEAPHLDIHVSTMVVDGTKCPGLEMGTVRVRFELGTPLEGVDGSALFLEQVLGESTRKLTLVTLKSYPQTSHPGAFSISSASKEDSPLMPRSVGRKVDQKRGCKMPELGLSSPSGKVHLTERVYNAFLLLLDVLEATDPLSTITHGTDSSGPVWALESGNEEVP